MVDVKATKLDALAANPFLDGPGEFLCKTIATEVAKERAFAMAFGPFIDGYARSDYAISNLPALRVYCDQANVTSHQGYLEGVVKLDVIWPPSVRRVEGQLLQDMVSAALLLQFRRPTFYANVKAATGGDALTELGRRYGIDKTLGFSLPDADLPAPVTQLTPNFRFDMHFWDLHMTQQGRTQDDPFEVTMANLTAVQGTILGVDESGRTIITVPIAPQES